MLNKFDPETTALVLIDHQVGTLQLIKGDASDLTLRNAVKLAGLARVLGLPVVMTSSQEDQGQGPIAPELQRALPAAFERRVKRVGAVNAWTDPDFKAAVEATGCTQLVIAGVTTDMCLVCPSIGAAQGGFDVQAVLDASGSLSESSDYASCRRIEHESVALTATNTLIAEFVQDWSTPQGMEMAKLTFASARPAGVHGRFGT